MLRTLSRIRHEFNLPLRFRCRVPEELGDRPGTVSVENQQAVSFGFQRLICPRQRFSRWPLQKRSGLAINWPVHEIVSCCVANIQPDCRIDSRDLDKVGFPKLARFFRWSVLAAAQQNNSQQQRCTPLPNLAITRGLRTERPKSEIRNPKSET